EVAAEGDGVPANGLSDVVHQLNPAFFVEVGVSSVYADGKDVADFQVRLRGLGGKIEEAVSVLHPQFVHQRVAKGCAQRADDGLIAERVLFESRGQVEAVIERRNIVQALIVEEVTSREIVPLIKGVV